VLNAYDRHYDYVKDIDTSLWVVEEVEGISTVRVLGSSPNEGIVWPDAGTASVEVLPANGTEYVSIAFEPFDDYRTVRIILNRRPNEP
jgi:hypothetical protein